MTSQLQQHAEAFIQFRLTWGRLLKRLGTTGVKYPAFKGAQQRL